MDLGTNLPQIPRDDCIYSEILYSHKKEYSTDAYNNVDEPQKYYAKWKKLVKKGHIL